MAKRKKEWYPIGSRHPRAAAWHARNDAKNLAQLDRDIAAGKVIRVSEGWYREVDPRKKKRMKIAKVAVGVAAGGILAALLFRS